MNASLRALLSGVVDYAGLFPPAKLPLDEAIHNYARYRQESDAWMLGRFVIPATRLRELDAFADLFQAHWPVSLAVLGGGDAGADGEAVAAFRAKHAGKFLPDVMELRGPPDANTTAWLGGGVALFYESPAVPAFNDFTDRRIGFKLRTGGLEASAFPTVEQVAFAIRSCRDAGAPMKFTAGLHHPIRHFDAGLQTPMHGFINVFVAGVLAHARRLGDDDLRAVLADEGAASFLFTDDGLRWRDHHASTAEIAAARRDFVTSFGSCSFDEPRADLRALGWM